MEVKEVQLKEPSLNSIACVLQAGLTENFEEVSVKVTQCPDLTQEPFHLASEGLCSKACIADIGGPPYLAPVVKKDKVYNLDDIANKIGLPNALLIGAGAGPWHHTGINSEMMPNIKLNTVKNNVVNNTYIATVNEAGDYVQEKLEGCTDMCLLANLFASEGKSGPVIEVKVKKRIGSKDFVSCMRESLGKHFGDAPVGMGGAFLINKGKAKLHVMPKFSATPLNSDEDVNNWLKFYEMSAPLICLSVFVSHDPDLDLRVQHTHCFSNHGDGGHYHYDTTPDEVEYVGYFNVAERLFRIDQPKDTNDLGRC